MEYVTPLRDKDVPEHLSHLTVRLRVLCLRTLVEPWEGAIWYRLGGGGFTLLHAPEVGPCCNGWQHLKEQEKVLQNDRPTTWEGVRFWAPHLLKGSMGKSPKEQMELLWDVRQEFELPGNFLTNFGTAAELSALILSHYERTGERSPYGDRSVTTDTLGESECPLVLRWYNKGGPDYQGLMCGYMSDDMSWPLDYKNPKAPLHGCFPLGMEA